MVNPQFSRLRNGSLEAHPVIKDDHNMLTHKLPDPEKFFPAKVRMTLIQVSKGAKYDPKVVPNLPRTMDKK